MNRNSATVTGKDHTFKWFFETAHCKIFHGNSYQFLSNLKASFVNFIVTSPHFGLVREKEYGNVPADEYIDWFRLYATQFHRLPKDSGSLVIDIGRVWSKGEPTCHLNHCKLLIMLYEEYECKIVQDLYCWNPDEFSILADWLTVRRIRARDAMSKIWRLSKTQWPKTRNRRVRQSYSDSMEDILVNGYKPSLRPSRHGISDQFQIDNAASIPPNLLAIANTESNSQYLRYCRSKGLKPHPARFPENLPEYFVRMMTDKDDLVQDPFARSCVTGEGCEQLAPWWICAELRETYLKGPIERFGTPVGHAKTNGGKRYSASQNGNRLQDYFRTPRIGLLWNQQTTTTLPKDAGRKPPASLRTPKKHKPRSATKQSS